MCRGDVCVGGCVYRRDVCRDVCREMCVGEMCVGDVCECRRHV